MADKAREKINELISTLEDAKATFDKIRDPIVRAAETMSDKRRDTDAGQRIIERGDALDAASIAFDELLEQLENAKLPEED